MGKWGTRRNLRLIANKLPHFNNQPITKDRTHGNFTMKRGASKLSMRQKKGDRIINPGATKDNIMVDMAVVEFDRMAAEMDRKWGIDRLVDLVTPEMAIKYGQALARLNEAVSDGSDGKLALRRANDCVRGMLAMDACHFARSGACISPLFRHCAGNNGRG
mgnify:CR=1 FL=1